MSSCWFCGRRSAKITSSINVTLRKNISSTTRESPVFMGSKYTTVTTYRTNSVTVPRCSECEAIHKRKRLLTIIYYPIVLALLIYSAVHFSHSWIPLLIANEPQKGDTWGIIIFSACMGIFGVAFFSLVYGAAKLLVYIHILARYPKEYRQIKGLGAMRKYPALAGLLRSGWYVS